MSNDPKRSTGWGGGWQPPVTAPQTDPLKHLEEPKMTEITHCGWGVRASDVVAAARKFMADNGLGTALKKAFFLNPSKEAREYMATRNRLERTALEEAANAEV